MKWVLFLAILASCGIGGKAVNMDAFSGIALGTTSGQIVAALGTPYAINNKEDGCTEYEYIERTDLDGWGEEEHIYYLLMRDDVVISKTMKENLFVLTWEFVKGPWASKPR